MIVTDSDPVETDGLFGLVNKAKGLVGKGSDPKAKLAMYTNLVAALKAARDTIEANTADKNETITKAINEAIALADKKRVEWSKKQ
jgi:hypothetical protein